MCQNYPVVLLHVCGVLYVNYTPIKLLRRKKRILYVKLL